MYSGPKEYISIILFPSTTPILTLEQLHSTCILCMLVKVSYLFSRLRSSWSTPMKPSRTPTPLSLFLSTIGVTYFKATNSTNIYNSGTSLSESIAICSFFSNQYAIFVSLYEDMISLMSLTHLSIPCILLINIVAAPISFILLEISDRNFASISSTLSIILSFIIFLSSTDITEALRTAFISP